MQDQMHTHTYTPTHVHKDVKGDLHPPKHSTYYTPKDTVHITHTPVLVCANTQTYRTHTSEKKIPWGAILCNMLFHWPVPPLGDPHTLDDVDRHLEEENKEEEEEAEGTVRPEEQTRTKG